MRVSGHCAEPCNRSNCQNRKDYFEVIAKLSQINLSIPVTMLPNHGNGKETERSNSQVVRQIDGKLVNHFKADWMVPTDFSFS